MAHNIEGGVINDRIEYFVNTYPWGFSEVEDRVEEFECVLTLELH